MLMGMIALCLTGSLTLTVALPAEIGGTGEMPDVAKYEPAKLNRKASQPNVYDYFFESRDREAFVVVQVDVNSQGKVERATAVDGFFNEVQAKAAEGIAMRLKFLPARRDGVAVPTFGATVPIRYTPPSSPKITKAYRDALIEAVRLIDERQWEAAQHQIDQMVRDEVTTASAYAAMHATLAETYLGEGRFRDALQSYRSASSRYAADRIRYVPGTKTPANNPKSYMIGEPNLTAVLRRRMLVEARLGHLVDSLNTFTELAGLTALPADDAQVTLARELENILRSGRDIDTDVQLNRFGRWSFAPNLRSFTIIGLEGALENLMLTCNQGMRELKYQSGVDWSIPASWEDCSLAFTGSPGATFKVRFFGSAAPQ